MSDADDGTTTWTSPHRRTYPVPSPWRPPPAIPSHARLAPPVAITPDRPPEHHDPDDDQDLTAMLLAALPAPAAPTVPPTAFDDDEPPF